MMFLFSSEKSLHVTDIYVMRQSACLVLNPMMVDNYAAFFNCTPVGRTSDSMLTVTPLHFGTSFHFPMEIFRLSMMAST